MNPLTSFQTVQSVRAPEILADPASARLELRRVYSPIYMPAGAVLVHDSVPRRFKLFEPTDSFSISSAAVLLENFEGSEETRTAMLVISGGKVIFSALRFALSWLDVDGGFDAAIDRLKNGSGDFLIDCAFNVR
jgi:hypothetical protein